MKHTWSQRMAGAIGLVFALSTAALAQPVRRADSVGFTICARCLDELRVSLYTAVMEVASEHPELEESLPGVVADLEAYLAALESALNSVGDDAQLANVDLQNILQKQQQTLQMLSNISKMLWDTALSVIRKIGG